MIQSRGLWSSLLIAGVVATVFASTRPAPVFADPTCPLVSQPGRTIAHLGGKMWANTIESEAKSGPFTLSIPAGNYKVTLVSYDTHTNYNPPQIQPDEIWYLQLTNTSGYTVNTGTISDLPDTIDWKTEIVNTNLTITEAVTSGTAFHPRFKDTNPNSIYPVCAAFDVIAPSPSPSPSPSNTPTPTPTPTVTPSPVVSPSVRPSATPTPTPSATVVAQVSPSPTPSATVSTQAYVPTQLANTGFNANLVYTIAGGLILIALAMATDYGFSKKKAKSTKKAR